MATKLLVVLALLALALVMGLGGGHMAWAESNLGGGGSGGDPSVRLDFRIIIPTILSLRLGTTVLGSSIAAQGGKVQVTCVDEGGCTWSLP